MDSLDLKPFFKRIGGEFRKRRMRQGLSQEDMIGHGFSARHWQQIEAGRPITMTTFVRACAVFAVRPSLVLREAEGEVRGTGRSPSPGRVS